MTEGCFSNDVVTTSPGQRVEDVRGGCVVFLMEYILVEYLTVANVYVAILHETFISAPMWECVDVTLWWDVVS